MKKIKKIAIIVPTINGGGAEKVASDLSLYFESNGYQVIFFVQELPQSMDYMYSGKAIQIPMTYCEIKNTHKKALSVLLKEAKTLKKLKKSYQIDIAISFMQDCNLINILSKGNDKVVVTLHSVTSKRKETFGTISTNKWTFRYLYQLADKIIFVSRYCQKDWIRNYGDIFHKTFVMYNPIGNVRKIEEIEKEKYGDKVIISVARMEGVKRPWHIVRMFSKVIKKFPDANLLMLGEGSLLPSIQKLAEKMKMKNNIHFLGYVANVEDYLNIAKVFVLASASEAYSCSIVESMRSGIPIVANDCPGGIRELLGVGERPRFRSQNLRTKCGTITPYLDGNKYGADDGLSIGENAMADAVIQILSDSMLYNTLSTNCKKRAKQFELNRIGAIWEREIIKQEFGICRRKS